MNWAELRVKAGGSWIATGGRCQTGARAGYTGS